MKNIVKILIISFALCTISISNIIFVTKAEVIYEDINPKIDVIKWITVPSDRVVSHIEIINHQNQSILKEPPSMKFYTTDVENPNLTYSKTVYNVPYLFDIIKKGRDDIIRLFVPSVYYCDGYEITTTSITLRIYMSLSHSFTITHEPQASEYEYLIITNDSFWATFNENFKQWKINNDYKINDILIVNVSDIVANSSFWINNSYSDSVNTTGGNPWITDGKEVTSNYTMFNDTQAIIRNYLRYCYDNHNTRYVLLGGNKDVVPPRMICSYAEDGSCGWTNDTSHASDMYYSNLHHCLNNNTNDRWMENRLLDVGCRVNIWDEIDWGFELYIGRVLFDTVPELNIWINKTKAYVTDNFKGNYLNNWMISAKNNTHEITNATWLILHGDTSPPSRIPANVSYVNNQNITAAQHDIIYKYCNGIVPNWDGIHMILDSGHAGFCAGELWNNYQPSLCGNYDRPNFVYTDGCHVGGFGETTVTGIEEWMNDEGCLFAGIANSAYGWFYESTWYQRYMMDYMFDVAGYQGYTVYCFCKAHTLAREVWPDPYAHPCRSMVIKETNFFGDPALEYRWHVSEEPQFISIDNGVNGTTVYSSNPTFNWSIVNNTCKYNLLIATDTLFTSIVVNITNINEYEFFAFYSANDTRVSFILPPAYSLPFYNTYYTKVKAYTKGW